MICICIQIPNLYPLYNLNCLSRIVIACQAIFNITGGLYDENSNNLIVNDNVWIIKLNQDKKITRWSMVWNPNKDTMVKAMDKVMTKLGKKTPEPNEHPSISLEEGLKFANDFMKALSSGLIKSNHTETFAKLFADHLSWDLPSHLLEQRAPSCVTGPSKEEDTISLQLS